MEVIVVLILSATLQFWAAYLAWRLNRVTEKKSAWIFIAAAIFLMAVRRCITLRLLLVTPAVKYPDLPPELIALLISILMVVGLSRIAPLFLAMKHSHDALTESEKRFRLLYERTPLGYQSLDENGYFIEVNQAWLDLLGYSREEVIGHWVGEFISPPYLEVLQKNFPRFKAEGEIRGVEYELVKKDGSVVIVSVNGRIGYDEEGNFKQTHCILYNMTDLKRMDEEQKRLISQLQEALQKVKTLSGMLPICSSCKKIRDDQGYWQQLESYIRDHSEAEFSHGLCPECAKKHFPEYFHEKN
ncbi:MAG: PAS domain S-box protein [Candidatus Omnitrophota bacterium]